MKFGLKINLHANLNKHTHVKETLFLSGMWIGGKTNKQEGNGGKASVREQWPCVF